MEVTNPNTGRRNEEGEIQGTRRSKGPNEYAEVEQRQYDEMQACKNLRCGVPTAVLRIVDAPGPRWRNGEVNAASSEEDEDLFFHKPGKQAPNGNKQQQHRAVSDQNTNRPYRYLGPDCHRV